MYPLDARHVREDLLNVRQKEGFPEYLSVTGSAAPSSSVPGSARGTAGVRGPDELQSAHESRRAAHRSGQQ